MKDPVILIGKAAESWVELQWMRFYLDCVLFPVFLVGLFYGVYRLSTYMKED